MDINMRRVIFFEKNFPTSIHIQRFQNKWIQILIRAISLHFTSLKAKSYHIEINQFSYATGKPFFTN